MDEPITSGDKLQVVEAWLEYMKAVDKTESWSYAEIAEVDSVYEILKDNIY